MVGHRLSPVLERVRLIAVGVTAGIVVAFPLPFHQLLKVINC